MYYSLVKSQVGQEEEEQKDLIAKKSSIQLIEKHESRVNYKDIQKEHDLAVEKEGVKHGEIFNLLKNNIHDVILAIFGSLIAGADTPTTGYVLSHVFINIVSGHYHQVWHKSLIWCFVFLGVAFCNGFFLFLKMWKLEKLGSVIKHKLT